MADPKVKIPRTISGNLNWIVEVFPFGKDKPEYGDFEGGGKPTSGPIPSSAPDFNIISSPVQADLRRNFTSLINDNIKGVFNGSKNPEVVKVSTGLTNLSFQRSKGNPASTCKMSIKGSTPEDMKVGSWVVVSSVSNIGLSDEQTVVRFIGQVFDVETSYGVNQEGLLTTTTQVFVREWSWALTTPIEYHVYSIAYDVARTGNASAIGGVLQSSVDLDQTGTSGEKSYRNVKKKLSDFFKKSFEPFEFAQSIMAILGMMQDTDYLESMNIKKDEGFLASSRNFAVTAPSIPPKVLERLGISGVAASSAPFSGGFLNVVSGVFTNPVKNNGDWNGVFDQNGIQELKDKLREDYESSAQKQRPRLNSYPAIAQTSMTAWDLINRYSDSSFYESYTDMWYEKDPTKQGHVIGKPVFVNRDKPFLLKGMLDQPWVTDRSLLDIWSKYEYIPRIRIDNAAITTFNIGNSSKNSPNYIRITALPGIYQKEVPDTIAGVAGTVRLDPEMRRFGGKSQTVPTAFLAFDTENENSVNQPGNKSFMSRWFATLKDVFRSWFSYDYRLGSGQLNLKNHNSILSVGFNAQFKIGEFDLVGHIEGYSINYRVGENNLGTTNIQVSLSNVTHVYDKEKNLLGFLNNNDFPNLIYNTPPDNFNLRDEE